MPEMGDVETTQRLHSLETHEGWVPLHVIAMTANAMKSVRKACMEAGMDDLLSKPNECAMLAAVLGAFKKESG